MRDFYVYGFRSRDEFTNKSARTYDDERRRVESWLGEHMRFRQTPDGKNVFISIDSRTSHHNPLYAAWKAKSFTDGDITLHFILFDILHSPAVQFTLSEITEKIDGYLRNFSDPRVFDESTVRKKLKEYESEGMIRTEKRGKNVYYSRSGDSVSCDTDLLDFFSETAPCGVIGSFFLDKEGRHDGHFAFKHHYITGAMDSEVLCGLLVAMGEKRQVMLEVINRHNGRIAVNQAVPLRIMISVQNGRQYLMAYVSDFRRITSFRIDNIISLKSGEVCDGFAELRQKLDNMLPHLWGVSTGSTSGQRMEHVEFIVRYADDEPHIHKRLVREKRCGRVERIDRNSSRFSADVYDSSELVPWIRTFICRITDISFSNKKLEAQFMDDLTQMYALYDPEGG